MVLLTGAISLPAALASGHSQDAAKAGIVTDVPINAPAASAETVAPQDSPSSAGPAGPKDETFSDEPSALRADGRAAADLPDVHCMARTICAIKDKIRWQTPAWTENECLRVAKAVLQSASRHDLSPTLLLAIMINESDLNEKAARLTLHGNKVYAKDGGLMAIRCVLDKHNHCVNGNVRGKTWTDVMTPATNIEMGARELAYWRDGGAISTVMVRRRDGSGNLRTVAKKVPCRHKDHAYWAHYNHGPRYIDHGYPRHYPHRVAVIDHALATVLNVDPPELHGTRITMHDAGKRERTVDRPLEARYKKLCTQIQSVHSCAAVAVN